MGTYLDPDPHAPADPIITEVVFMVDDEAVYLPNYSENCVDDTGALVPDSDLETAQAFAHFLGSNAGCCLEVIDVQHPSNDYNVRMLCTVESIIPNLRQRLMEAIREWNVARRKQELEVLSWHKVYLASKFNLSDELENEMI